MSAAFFSRVNLILSFVGLYIAGMLSLSHMLDIELPCGLGSGCDLVTQDPRSQLLGIPFAYYGLAGYVALMLVSVTRSLSPSFRPGLMRGLGYAMSAVGLFASIGLTVFSVTSLHAVCTWCIGSAITMSLLFVSHAWEAIQDRPVVNRSRGVDVGLLLAGSVVCTLALFSASSDLQAQAKILPVRRDQLGQLSEEELAPTDAHRTGPVSAQASVVIFADLTCPVCRSAFFHLTGLLKRRNDFNLVFRHLPLRTHPTAEPAALVSEIAAEQGKFWAFAEAVYTDYAASQEEYDKVIGRLGVDPSEVAERMSDAGDRIHGRVRRDRKLADRLGLHTTPSVFVVAKGFFVEPVAYEGVEHMLNDVAKQRREESK